MTLWEESKRDGSRSVHPPGVVEVWGLVLWVLHTVLSSHTDLVADSLFVRHQLTALPPAGGDDPPPSPGVAAVPALEVRHAARPGRGAAPRCAT
jgi:hypothetical protein